MSVGTEKWKSIVLVVTRKLIWRRTGVGLEATYHGRRRSRVPRGLAQHRGRRAVLLENGVTQRRDRR